MFDFNSQPGSTKHSQCFGDPGSTSGNTSVLHLIVISCLPASGSFSIHTSMSPQRNLPLHVHSPPSPTQNTHVLFRALGLVVAVMVFAMAVVTVVMLVVVLEVVVGLIRVELAVAAITVGEIEADSCRWDVSNERSLLLDGVPKRSCLSISF